MTWKSFPHDNAAFMYAGDSLQKHWPELHRGDVEPWPDTSRAEALLGGAGDSIDASLAGDAGALANQLRQAWRHYHCGEFAAAVEKADACGLAGHAVANKATGIYAVYLEPSDSRKQTLFQDMIDRATRAAEVYPDDASAHYFLAFGLGRYSQSISVAKALKQGMGGRIREALDTALTLAPKHAEAHVAMGLYHAEIVDKVGKLIGSMTYGASPDKALDHFQQALALAPDSPIVHMEYGNALYLLYGDKRIDEVTEAYITASEMTPIDAMQALDTELAADELE